MATVTATKKSPRTPAAPPPKPALKAKQPAPPKKVAGPLPWDAGASKRPPAKAATAPKPAPKSKAPPMPEEEEDPRVKPIPGFKIPKTHGACADLLYATRADRLALAKDLAVLEAKEFQLKLHLINSLPKSDSSGVAGKVARVTISTKTVPTVKDWNKLYKYMASQVAKNPGILGMLQRRVNAKAVEEMWDARVKVPGVEPFDAPTVGINKL